MVAKNKTAIGFIGCPVCGFVDMEIREDKNGAPYCYCPDCNIQIFTRTEERGNLLKARMRLVAPLEPAPAAGDETFAPVSDTEKTPPNRKPRRTMMGSKKL